MPYLPRIKQQRSVPPLPFSPLRRRRHLGWEVPTFTFVGADSTCTTVSPSASGPSISNFSFSINVPHSTYLTIAIGTPAAAGGTGFPNGTSFTATDGSESFPVQVQSNLFLASPVIQIPSGETTFEIQVSVPNPYQTGTYEFPVLIGTFADSARTSQTYGSYIPVNLIAQ